MDRVVCWSQRSEIRLPLLSWVLSSCCTTTTDAPRPVVFSTPDGGTVHADEYGEGARGLVLAHGAVFDKQSWAPQARAFAAAGYRVLAIDFRGYGESVAGSAGAEGRPLDVLGGVRYLRRTGARSVRAIGGSMGATAVAEAAARAEPGEIERVVLISSSSIARPEAIGGHKLFITTRGDAWADGSPRLPRVQELFERAPEPKQLVVLEGDAHAQHIFATAQGADLLHEILRFLAEP
jgi:pimeloyl-ACP methyl ester carboxylesterase